MSISDEERFPYRDSGLGGTGMVYRRMTPEIEARFRVACCKIARDEGTLTEEMVDKAAWAVYQATGTLIA